MMELIQQLVQNLGVSDSQAKGGAGLILKFAKEKLGESDFAKIAGLIPQSGDLISAAPEAGQGDSGGGLMGAVSGLASKMGGSVGQLGDIAQLKDAFGKLGLDAGMLQKFASQIKDFIESKGGDSAKGLLEKIMP